MGAIRFVQLGDGRRIAQHDDKNDVLHPQWSDIYPVEEIDGDTVLRCRIVAHQDNWEVGVTEDGHVLLGAGEGRVYSMPVEVAKKVSNLLGPAIPDAEVLAEAKRRGNGRVDQPL
jgi:hypothetical protein